MHQMDRRTVLCASLGLAISTAPAPDSERQTVRKITVSDKLSVDQLIGKMVVIGFWGSDPASAGVQAVCKWLKQGMIGGVIFFEDNLPSPQAAMDLTQTFREAAGASIPLLCLDQEGGAVARLRAERGFDPLPAARSVGAISHRAAEALYNRTAGELHRLGFNTNLGPVVDFALNPASYARFPN
jgi:beta-N-acetylhexosaminidase